MPTGETVAETTVEPTPSPKYDPPPLKAAPPPDSPLKDGEGAPPCLIRHSEWGRAWIMWIHTRW